MHKKIVFIATLCCCTLRSMDHDQPLQEFIQHHKFKIAPDSTIIINTNWDVAIQTQEPKKSEGLLSSVKNYLWESDQPCIIRAFHTLNATGSTPIRFAHTCTYDPEKKEVTLHDSFDPENECAIRYELIIPSTCNIDVTSTKNIEMEILNGNLNASGQTIEGNDIPQKSPADYSQFTELKTQIRKLSDAAAKLPTITANAVSILINRSQK